MKRFFKSDRESDALIEKITKLYGEVTPKS